jgi:hypothetical protein
MPAHDAGAPSEGYDVKPRADEGFCRWRVHSPRNRIAPSVSQRQAEVLRLARDAGRVTASECLPTTVRTARACAHHRWLAPRGGVENEHWIITDGGKAALAHYDADEAMEKLWRGLR